MSDVSLPVGEHTKVTLNFELSMSDGSVVDSTFEKSPASFEFGDGQLPEGFQECLVGMVAGDESVFKVLPEKAFGMSNPNNEQRFNRSDFAEDMELSEGLVISFADANQSELPGVVKSVGEDEVIVDFNHPLAGETLSFKAQIIKVEELSLNV